MQTEACKHIENLALDDTFYIIDLGNVQRMYKVNILEIIKYWGRGICTLSTALCMIASLMRYGILARG